MKPVQNRQMHNRPMSNRRGPQSPNQFFQSNGPNVKIRGTARQVAEQYLQLARDAHTGNDPVAAENYLQHAEHYFRLISAAEAAQFQAQKGDARARGESGPGGLGDDDDDLGGLPDRFASPGQQERQAFSDQTNAVVRAAPQPYRQRKPLVRREV